MIHPLRSKFQSLNKSPAASWILLLLLFFNVPIVGQTLSVNQLKTALGNANPDRERVSILVQLGEKLGASDYSTAIYYLQEALALSKQISDQRGQADALLHLGIVYFIKMSPRFPLAILKKQSNCTKRSIVQKASQMKLLPGGGCTI